VRVAGSTAPLWTALLALAGGAAWAPVAAKLLGLAAHLTGLVLMDRLVRQLGGSRGAAAVAVVAFGVTDRLVFAALSGMEVSLFNVFLLAGLLRHGEERADAGRPPVSFLLFGLAALARPEGLLLPLLAALDRALRAHPGGADLEVDGRGLRRAAVGLAVAAVIVVPVALAYLAISGSPLPTTLGAKASGPPRFALELRHLRIVLEILFQSQPVFTLLAAGGAVTLASRIGTPRDRGLLLPMWTFALPIASAMLSSGEEFLAGNFGRYFFPLLPCVILLGLVALEPVASARLRTLRLAGALRLPLVAIGLAVLLLPPLQRTARVFSLHLQARTNVEQTDLAAARWLAAHVTPEARLAVVDIGLVKYLLPNPVVDLGGIVSPERQEFVRRARREQGASWPVALQQWLETQQPDYVVSFPKWFPILEREPERFPPLVRFRIRDNVAMAGDELVVYATPWSRPATRREPAGTR